MLKKFTVRNYKNFKDDICVDFQNTAGYQFSSDCITDGMISKMLIYGRNATGKTNLGTALMDIRTTLSGLPRPNKGIFLNADSKEETAIFCYTFQFGDNEIIYKYERSSSQELRNEELTVDGITIFKCDFFGKNYTFDNLKCIHAETANTERYLQALDEEKPSGEIYESTLPFLRWIINNVALTSDSLLIKLLRYVDGMVMMAVSSIMMFNSRINYDTFFKSLETPGALKDFEDFLNVMGIECRLVLAKLPDGQLELYFSHNKLVPFFENASSGTLALVNLYRRFVSILRSASFMYLDEFDAFYHYKMSENVIKFFKKKYPNCQIIMTSHNTNLMTNRLMRPDCLFILSRTGTLTALCNATRRELREGHNLEKMYISGEFEKYE